MAVAADGAARPGSGLVGKPPVARVDAPLLPLLRQRIAAEGPITVAAFMADCLLHPEHVYYRPRAAIGLAGDFTTAPATSQLSGEQLGLWAADIKRKHDAPARRYTASLEPGGAARRLPAFSALRSRRALWVAGQR